MKTSYLTLSLAAALFASPAMAQAELAEAGLAPSKKPIHFEIGDVDADFGVVLLSLDDGAVPFLGGLILSDAAVVMMKKAAVDGELTYDFDLPRKWSDAIYWQGVTYGAKRGLAIHPIEKLELAADLAAQLADDTAPAGLINADFEPAGAKGKKLQNGGIADGSVREQQPAPIVQLEPIALKLAPVAEGTLGSELHARFLAPTNDYDLVLVRIDSGNDDGSTDMNGTADVYLYRKVPGQGEGMLDVTEEHSVTATWSGAKVVRVFLAEGTRSRPGVATAWKLLATLK